MSTEKKAPPAIAPKVVAPRPDTPGRPNSTPPPPPPPGEKTRNVEFDDVSDETSVRTDRSSGESTDRSSGESKVAVARAGAVKAAAAAMAAARTAKKKAAPSAGREKPSAVADPTNEDTVPAESAPGIAATPASPSPDLPAAGSTMHYSLGKVSGTTTVMNAPAPETSGAAAPTPPPRESTKGSSGTPATGSTREDFAPRKVRLAISKVNPWSVMKLAFLLSVGIGIMIVVAVIVFWLILDGMHVFTKVDDFIKQVVGDGQEVNIMQFVEFSKVVSMTLIVAVVNVLLSTALATIMAFLYNVTSSLVGGLHVTLTDD